MKVLMSIKPEYVSKIFLGEKKYEFRRSIFKNKSVKTILIYSTFPEKKIVGEFSIEKIIEETPSKLWDITYKYSGIEEEKFYKYFIDKNKGYAIKIKSVIKYKIPKELSEFNIKRAPQSYMYISDKEDI